MKSIPQQVSKSMRARNPQLYGGVLEPVITGVVVNGEVKPVTIPPKRIRQSTKPLMNRLEGEWALVLHERYGQFGFPVFPQSIRFKLGNGIWYKPDFVVFGEQGIIMFECKGPHAFRGGKENLKVAAHHYNSKHIHWHLVWKQDGKWQEQVVLP